MKLSLISALILVMMTFGCTKPKPHADTPAAPAENFEQTLAKSLDAFRANPNFDNAIATGLLYSTHGAHSEALKYFQMAEKVSPNSPVVLNNICAELNSLQNFNQAQVNCEKALKAEPNFVLAQNNLAYAKSSIAHLQKSIADLTKSMNAQNRDASELDIGVSFNTLGDTASAVKHWARVSSKSPWYATAQNNIGSSEILAKNYAAAEKSLKAALKIEPDNQLFKNNLKWLDDERQKTK